MVDLGLPFGPVDLQVAHHQIFSSPVLKIYEGVRREERSRVEHVGVGFARRDEQQDGFFLAHVKKAKLAILLWNIKAPAPFVLTDHPRLL
jgi:hypothetical protein